MVDPRRIRQSGAKGVVAQSQGEIKIVMWLCVATFLWLLTFCSRASERDAERCELRERPRDTGVLQ
jgi:hypothetical protein